jgi:cyclophilin family peptidyl-prolyl cis-trans isomerase
LSLDGQPLGRLTLALFGRSAPRTVENFFQHVLGQSTPAGAGYRGTPINWVKKNSWVAAGQLRFGYDGRPLPSIYGGGDLERESPRLRHYGAGWVHAWSNNGFRILLNPEPSWDGQYVVFGKVKSGLEAVRQIAELEPLHGVPPRQVRIVDCGGEAVCQQQRVADPEDEPVRYL